MPTYIVTTQKRELQDWCLILFVNKNNIHTHCTWECDNVHVHTHSALSGTPRRWRDGHFYFRHIYTSNVILPLHMAFSQQNKQNVKECHQHSCTLMLLAAVELFSASLLLAIVSLPCAVWGKEVRTFLARKNWWAGQCANGHWNTEQIHISLPWLILVCFKKINN